MSTQTLRSLQELGAAFGVPVQPSTQESYLPPVKTDDEKDPQTDQGLDALLGIEDIDPAVVASLWRLEQRDRARADEVAFGLRRNQYNLKNRHGGHLGGKSPNKVYEQPGQFSLRHPMPFDAYAQRVGLPARSIVAAARAIDVMADVRELTWVATQQLLDLAHNP